MKFLKFFIISLVITVMCAASTMAADITLAWDANNPAPSGYALFVRSHNINGGLYDYNAPVWTGSETQATLTVPDGFEYAFVCRAFVDITKLDGSTQRDWSGDSNEVTQIASQTPAPKNLLVNAIQYLAKAIENLAMALDQMK